MCVCSLDGCDSNPNLGAFHVGLPASNTQGILAEWLIMPELASVARLCGCSLQSVREICFSSFLFRYTSVHLERSYHRCHFPLRSS